MNNKVKKKFATNDKLSNHGLQGQGCPSPDVLLNVVRILQYNYRYLDNPYPESQILKFKYNLLKQKKNHTKQQNQLPAAKKDYHFRRIQKNVW